MKIAAYPIAEWQAQERPYCATIFSKTHERSRPYGKRRFQTVADALAWIARRTNPHDYSVDYAGFYERKAS